MNEDILDYPKHYCHTHFPSLPGLSIRKESSAPKSQSKKSSF
ncbi:hypothetical protein AAHH67_03025 [Niallia circulans]